jgi:large repetitive protein
VTVTPRKKFATVAVCSLLSTIVVTAASAAVPGIDSGAAASDLPTCGDNGTPTVTALANPTFYIDSGISPQLNSNYAGFTIRTTSSETNLRIALTDLTGTNIRLASGETGIATYPTLSAGNTYTSFFLLRATAASTTPQTHGISLFRGANEICRRTFTYSRVAETIKALANKVDSVQQVASTDAFAVGDTVTVTVRGRTGTLGAGPGFDPGVLSYAPTAIDGFPVEAWRLERTEMTIKPTGTEATDSTFVDRLYLTGASGPDRPYVARYIFRAIGYSATPAIVRPIQYIASGTQVKHTDVAGSVSGELPSSPTESNLLLTKTSNITSVQLAESQSDKIRVNYTVSVINSGGSTGTLDRIVDTLPSGATYVSATAKLANRAVTPIVTGQDLTLYGPINIAAGGTVLFTYSVDINPTAGTYTNSAVGYYASTVIDGSTDVRASDPASSSVTLFAPAGALTTAPEAVITNPGTPIVIDVLANDDLGIPTSVKYNSEVTQLSVSTNPATGSTQVVTDPTNVNRNRIIYTPAGSFGGSETFQYTVTYGPSSATATVTVQVPKANYDEYLTTANSLTVATADGLLKNDLCPVNNPLGSSTEDLTTGCKLQTNSLTMASGVAGTITQNADNNGGFTFTAPNQTHPRAGYSFVYVLEKTIGAQTWTANGTGRIYINNAGPDRRAMGYRETDNNIRDINVTANDSGCSPSPCRMPSNNWDSLAPSNGTITRVNENVIRYAPNAGFAGVNTFQYNLQGGSQGTEVTVLVAPPNGSYTTPFNEPITKDINSTFVDDFYGTGKPSPTNALFSCPTCEFSISQSPSKGTASVANVGASASRTGRFTYTPLPTAVGSDTFKIGITHETGLFVEHQITISIGPKAVNDTGITTMLGSSTTFNVLTNDNCPGDCTITNVTSPKRGDNTTSGTLTNNGGGSFTYSNNTDIGTITFNYTITSSLSGDSASTATVTILVNGAVNDVATTSPGTPVNINVRANDPCTGCSVSQVSRPTVGTATINTNGTVTYLPPAGFAGTATFTYTITKDGQTSTATVTVTVRPDARNDQYSAQTTQNLTLDVLNNDICADCRITGVTTPSGSGATATISDDGYSINYRAPNSGSSDSFTYTITDSTDQTDTADVTITIATSPSAVNDAEATVAGGAVSINVASNDTCTNSPCQFEVASDAANGSVSISVQQGRQFSYVPRPGFTGRDSFTYTIITNAGLTATATVTINVRPVANDNFYVAGTNQTITITAGSNDVCADCDWILRAGPGAGKGTLGSFNTSGNISYTAPANPGTYSFTYKVRERGFGPQVGGFSIMSAQDEPAENEAFATVTILVGDATPDAVATNYNTPVTSLNVISNDTCASASCIIASNSDVSAVSPVGAGTAARVSNTTVSFTPSPNFSGIATFTYTASYGDSTATATVTVLVGPPVIEKTIEKNAQIGRFEDDNDLDTPPPLAFLATDADPDFTCTSDRCTYELRSPSAEPGQSIRGEISVYSDGTYAYRPETDSSYTEADIYYIVTDTETGLTREGVLRITISSEASLRISKTGSINLGDNARADAGDIVTYTFTIQNDGDVEVTNISVLDDKILNDNVNIVCPGRSGFDDKNIISSLAPDPEISVVCTGTYILTQSDVDSGLVTNVGSVSGSAVVSGGTVQATASTTANVNITRTASTTLEKFAGSIVDRDASNTDTVGDTITYTYRATNTGNVTLTNVTVVDDKIADDAANIECAGFTNGIKNRIPTLAPNSFATCTAVYALTQADIDAKQVTNTATATATPPSGSIPPSPSSSSVTVLVDQKVTIDLVKSVIGTSWTSPAKPVVGSTITYRYRVTNTGTVGLSNITVVDDKIANDATNIVCAGRSAEAIKNVIPALDAAAVVDCQATYSVTQADIDAGSVTNIAIASTNYTAEVNSTLVTSTITAIDDVTVSGLNTVGYTMTKSGVANPGANSWMDAGETITYTYTVTNTGSATLSAITVVDDKIEEDAAAISCQSKETTPKNVVTNLAPGAVATCVAEYVVTQADLNAGFITNIASGTSSPATDPATVEATATVIFTQVSTMSVVKSAGAITDTDSNLRISAGDTIPYSFVVTNTGNVTLANITVTDNKIADDNINVICPDRDDEETKNVIASLVPGASQTCVATYTITSADYNNASVTNIATAQTSFGAYDPTAPDTPSNRDVSNTDTVTVSLADPKLSLTLTGSLALTTVAPNDRADAGDLVTYTYVITNTGNVTLTDIDVEDLRTSAGSIDCDSTTPGIQTAITSLAPGASRTCTATYPITQGNIDAGTVANTATAMTQYPNDDTGVTVADTDNASVSITRTTSATIAKSASAIADTNESNREDAGDTITYTITVTNTGNTTLEDVMVTDAKLADLDCDANEDGNQTQASALLPAGTLSCVGTYVLTQSDVNSGSIENTASVSANDGAIAAEDEVATSITHAPSLSITNTAGSILDSNNNSITDAGDTIPYTYVVTNTGNVSLTDIVVLSTGLDVTCTAPTSTTTATIDELTPGQQRTCTTSYELVEGDFTDGSVSNTATASTTFNSATVTDSDEEITYLAVTSLSVSKAVTDTSYGTNNPAVGDTITYVITVENTGDVQLSAVEVSDPLLGNQLDCDPNSAGNQNMISSIASGASATCTGTYTLLQNDVDSGSIENTASASTGALNESSNTVTTTLNRLAGLTMTKTGVLNNAVVSPSDTTQAGDTITYTYRITNSGNVTLTNVTMVDDKIPDDTDIRCPAGVGSNNVITTLLPGQDNAVECEAVYVITASDVLGTTVTNVATVTGTAPANVTNPITTATETVTINPSFDANLNPLDAADDEVEAPMGAIVEIEVLANDVGDNLMLISVDPPSNGTNRIVGNIVELTPDLLFVGTIEFNYTISNGSSTSTAKTTVRMVDNSLQPLPEIFLDINSNGIRDPDEPGITGINMSTKLYSRAVARTRPGEPARVSASRIRTSANDASVRSASFSDLMQSTPALMEYSCNTSDTGGCTFGRVPIGNYRIEANFEPIKHGMRRTTQSEDPIALVGTATPQGNSMNKVYFGVTGRCALKGFAFADIKKNGVFDPDKDVILRRQELRIYWNGVDQKMDTDDDVMITTRTDKDGNYTVENLPTGTYRVLGIERSINCTLSQAELRDFSIVKTVRTNVPFDARFARLPETGAGSRRALHHALALLLSGAVLLIGSRRRRISSVSHR